MNSEASFRAMIVSEGAGGFTRSIETRLIKELPEGDVLVRVLYASLNHKDALSTTGNKGVTREYPHTPGIDAAGLVIESRSQAFAAGDAVIVHGNDLGMNTAGGFGEYIRVPAEWVLHMPEGLTARDSMILGTAGFTAALCLETFESGKLVPAEGPIVVSGATGGVGCLAISLLAHRGYTVIAVTGKLDRKAALVDLGASEVLGREEILDASGRPLLTGRWAGVVDTVGGESLDCLIRATLPRGIVAACGNVSSGELRTNVYPFILRGVRLQGIDSAATEMSFRRLIWQRLASDWKFALPGDFIHETSLDNLSDKIEAMLRGDHHGRIIVKHEQDD